jgi:hypothetical protein
MNRPTSLRIGAFDIAIETMTPVQVQVANGHGSFSSAELMIRVEETAASPASAVDTLLHEIGHAIWFAYLLEDTDKEERTVATMATAWTQIYRDNPELVAWIAATLEHPRPVLAFTRDDLEAA